MYDQTSKRLKIGSIELIDYLMKLNGIMVIVQDTGELTKWYLGSNKSDWMLDGHELRSFSDRIHTSVHSTPTLERYFIH